jgi:hypothetical protein
MAKNSGRCLTSKILNSRLISLLDSEAYLICASLTSVPIDFLKMLEKCLARNPVPVAISMATSYLFISGSDYCESILSMNSEGYCGLYFW